MFHIILRFYMFVPCRPKELSVLDRMSKLIRKKHFVCSTKTCTREEVCIGPGYRRIMIRSVYPQLKQQKQLSNLLNGEWGRSMTAWHPKSRALLYLPKVLLHALLLNPCLCPPHAIPNLQPPLVTVFLTKSGGSGIYWLMVFGIIGPGPVSMCCSDKDRTNGVGQVKVVAGLVVWDVLHKWRMMACWYHASAVCVQHYSSFGAWLFEVPAWWCLGLIARFG